ncbi:MAG: SLC13 family permease [Gemmatimonadales bacterium]
MSAGPVIFAATYVLIAVQRLPIVHLNRRPASLLGAVAMIVFGVLSLEQAYAAIDFDVLVFLLGLMLIVGYLEVGKFFEWALLLFFAALFVVMRGLEHGGREPRAA